MGVHIDGASTQVQSGAGAITITGNAGDGAAN